MRALITSLLLFPISVLASGGTPTSCSQAWVSEQYLHIVVMGQTEAQPLVVNFAPLPGHPAGAGHVETEEAPENGLIVIAKGHGKTDKNGKASTDRDCKAGSPLNGCSWATEPHIPPPSSTAQVLSDPDYLAWDIEATVSDGPAPKSCNLRLDVCLTDGAGSCYDIGGPLVRTVGGWIVYPCDGYTTDERPLTRPDEPLLCMISNHPRLW